MLIYWMIKSGLSTDLEHHLHLGVKMNQKKVNDDANILLYSFIPQQWYLEPVTDH